MNNSMDNGFLSRRTQQFGQNDTSLCRDEKSTHSMTGNSPLAHNTSVRQLSKPSITLNQGKALKKIPSFTTSRRVEGVNVFRDASRMCGIGCLIERENEFDNPSELDLSATSSPLKMRRKGEGLPGGFAGQRPMEITANSRLSFGSNEQNFSSYNHGYRMNNSAMMESQQQNNGQ